MAKKTEAAEGGIGLCGAVFIVFLILKLCEIGQVAHWSWLWVTSPLWLPLAVVLGIAGIFLLIAWLFNL